ncbi:chromosome segregation protein SMC [Paenibacillus terrae]|uniref:chromosome segregation protein SMC n=1 Tax=Paenibacillus terrae TaxID=159743 RepID=UPI0011EB5D04|nr:chromosome segregation protein SMC [Paenibacillus terrae]
MIPWEMSISGIRDYPPTRLDLSGDMEHILITGPNGSGKSTLTFCMGAVLNSVKVELEGLRSKNIEQHQVWNAQIQLVFANVSPNPIDAAPYIQFTVQVEQKPFEPLKRQYWIREGEQIGVWDKETRFTSGDSVNNFKEYRFQLQHKYVVDPDAFYLIWYQQDVNQFATMRPEERFRIFSEMTQIDKMQRTWEGAKEQLLDGMKTREEAERNQIQHNFELERWQKERDKLLNRNRSRLDNLRIFVQTSTKLQDMYQYEQKLLEGQIEQLELEEAEHQEKKVMLLTDMERLQETQTDRQLQKEELELRLQTVELQLIRIKSDIAEREQEHKELTIFLKDLAEEIRGIKYSAEEVNILLAEVQKGMKETEEKRSAANVEDLELQANIDKLLREMGRLSALTQQDREEEKRSREVLREFGESSHVQRQIETLDARHLLLQDESRQLTGKLENLKQEESSLNTDKFMSKRQEESVRMFRHLGIQVYTMQQLLEMNEQAPLEQEFALEAVKYSIFVDSKSFIPPNDLIHVELPSVVPERSLKRLEKLHIQVKEGLNDEMYAAAQRVMWWLYELEQGAHWTRIENGILREPYVRRGPQEEKQSLLHTRGILIRKGKVQEEIRTIQQNYDSCIIAWDKVKERLGVFRSVHLQVQQAETFLADSADRELRIKQLQQSDEESKVALERRTAVKAEIKRLNEIYAKQYQESVRFQEYADVYERYEHEREQIERLQQLDKELEELRGQEEELILADKDLDKRLHDLDTQIESTKRRLRDKKSQMLDTEGTIVQINRQKEKSIEQRDVFQRQQAEINLDLEKWHEKLDFLWDEIEQEKIETEDMKLRTEPALQAELEQARTRLQLACNERVNEFSIENYESTREAFERGAQDLQNARLLMEQLEEQLKELEDKLFNTVKNEVHRVNQKFINYMDLFGFDGEVTWHHQEGKHGELKYFLNVRARKQGHRGPLEEVSLKGRGNKVGKGVSGGEESLSSLLFALALLKTIETNPGYIILDEFDSALDESRKEKVFELYEQELARKMIILSPKSQNADYLQHFDKSFVVYHDSSIPKSEVIRIKKSM